MRSYKVLLCVILLILILNSISFGEDYIIIKIDGVKVEFNKDSGYPLIDENYRSQVPFRAAMEAAGATIFWNADTFTATAEKGDIRVNVPIGKSYILRNDEIILMDTISITKNGRTYLPIKYVMEAFNYEVTWNSQSQSVNIKTDSTSQIEENEPVTANETVEVLSNGINEINEAMTINGKEIDVKGYNVNLENSNLSMKTVLAHDSVGLTESLKDLAIKHNAILAINGSYFSAYMEDNQDPYGILVVDGEIVHNGSKRATFGFKDNEFDIDIVSTKLYGKNGYSWKDAWYGYFLNHGILENQSSITIYSDERGEYTRNPYGINYVVDSGTIVRRISSQSVKIPKDGYVININGDMGSNYNKFSVGKKVDLEISLNPKTGNEEYWNSLDGAIGAGPLLIMDGHIDLNLDAENFTEEKIRTQVAARSAIGYKKDGTLVFVVVTSTIDELAKIMKNLGCYEAMNLDGGASSGLYFDGELIRTPGRDISNAIIIY